MFVETSSITLQYNNNDNRKGLSELKQQQQQQHQHQKEDDLNNSSTGCSTNNNNTSTSKNTNSCSTSSITIKGYSRGGDGTCFIIPEYKWMLDCGVPIISNNGWLPTTIFLTHTHADHIYNLTRILHNAITTTTNTNTNTKSGKSKQKQQQQQSIITVYAPAGCVQFLQNYLDAHLQLINYQTDVSTNDSNDKNNASSSSTQQETTTTTATTVCCNNYKIIPVQPGEEYKLTTTKYGGYQYFVQIVQCYHRIECVGYSFYRTSTKLKEQYTNLTNDEIKKIIIRNNNNKQKQNQHETDEEVFSLKETIQQSLLLFLGDTTHEAFVNNLSLLKEHSYIIVECTFLFDNNNNNNVHNNNNAQDNTTIDTTIEKATISQHMHWIHLQNYIQQYSNILFILIHFSLRYNNYMIRQFFNNQNYINIHPILNESEILYYWQQEQEQQQQREQQRCQQLPLDEINKQQSQNLLETNHDFNANNNYNKTPPKCICFICNPTTASTTIT